MQEEAKAPIFFVVVESYEETRRIQILFINATVLKTRFDVVVTVLTDIVKIIHNTLCIF